LRPVTAHDAGVDQTLFSINTYRILVVVGDARLGNLVGPCQHRRWT
jgi:hypothetical protein